MSANSGNSIQNYITKISKLITNPQQVNSISEGIHQIFQQVLSNQQCISSTYHLGVDMFYYNLYKYILLPILSIKQINSTQLEEISNQYLSILIDFLKLFNFSFETSSKYLLKIIDTLFNPAHPFYQISPSFINLIQTKFVEFQFFDSCIKFIDLIPTNADLSKQIALLPIYTKILFQTRQFVDPEPDSNEICTAILKLLLSLPKETTITISPNIFPLVFANINKNSPNEVISLWIDVFYQYLTSDNMSFLLFTIKSMSLFLKSKDFKDIFLSFFTSKKHDKAVELVQLFLKKSIRDEFGEFQKSIYIEFLNQGIITFEQLTDIWSTRDSLHITYVKALDQLFICLSKEINKDFVDQFNQLILTTHSLSIALLSTIIQIATNLNDRKINVSCYIQFLTDICNDDDYSEQLKEKAQKALPRLQVSLYDSHNYKQFLSTIYEQTKTQTESHVQIELLSLSLPKFSIRTLGTNNQKAIQKIFESIVKVFPRHDLETMKTIVLTFISDLYGCKFNESSVNNLLSHALIEDFGSSVYGFLTDLCLINRAIDIDLFLSCFMKCRNEVTRSFYRAIKSLILNLNDGGVWISKFPFHKEEVLWHFCVNDNDQVLRFQHFLCRLYMRNTTTDEEMIRSFLDQWLQAYNAAIKDQENRSDIIDFYQKFLSIFIRKIENFIYVPYNYHFANYKTNRVSIEINCPAPNGSVFTTEFPFDQRRTIATLIHYIKIQNHYNFDFNLKYRNSILSLRERIQDEIDDIDELKEDNCPVVLYLVRSKTRNEKPLAKLERTSYPSKIIAADMDGIDNHLFDAGKYPTLFYFLPTFSNTISAIKNISNQNIHKFLPVDNPIKFIYNLESFLDYYSSEQMKNSDINSVIQKSGLIRHLVQNGLSVKNRELLVLIFNFLRDYSAIEVEDILIQKLDDIIKHYIDDEKTDVLEALFKLTVSSFPIDFDILYHLLFHKKECIRRGARAFLRNIPISLDYFRFCYDESRYEPNSTFYYSLGDHIALSQTRCDNVVDIIRINLKKVNPEQCYLYCIKQALKKPRFLNQKEIAKIGQYIAQQFIIDQMKCLPKVSLDYAVSICPLVKLPMVADAIQSLIEKVVPPITISNDYVNVTYYHENSFHFRPSDCDAHYNPTVDCIEHPIGLHNFGCTCYINSILQQLFHITDFHFALLETMDVHETKDPKVYNLASSLFNLFSELQYSYSNQAIPQDFIDEFGGIDVSVQCDCREFFLSLIDRLKITLFDGKLKNVITSTTDSNKKSESFEPFTVLTLPIRNLDNLDESLDQFFAADYFNDYAFSDSDEKCNVKKTCEFGATSNHLIIQLNRFDFDYETNERTKITSKFAIDTEIELNNKRYDLTGIVVHKGSSADSGHYISYIRKAILKNDAPKEYSHGDWFEISDTDVSDVSTKYALKEGCQDGYLLFYTHCDSAEYPEHSCDDIHSKNSNMILNRMVYSEDFNYLMLDYLNHPETMECGLDYFFKLSFAYNDSETLIKLSELLLSKCETDFQLISKYVSKYPIENLLLYCETEEVREYTVLILQEITKKVDIFDVLNSMIKRTFNHLYQYLYSTNEYFQLVDSLTSNEKFDMTTLLSSYLYLFKKLQNLQTKIEYKNVNLDYFLATLKNLENISNFEDVILMNVSMIERILESPTSFDVIVDFMQVLPRKAQIIGVLNSHQVKSESLVDLIAQLDC